MHMRTNLRFFSLLLAGVVGIAGTALGATTVQVAGPQLVDEQDVPVQLHGINRMSTEYACIFGFGILGGPATPEENDAALSAMQGWNINAVRVPVNADCWLGTKPGLDPTWAGERYQAAIAQWIGQMTARGMVAILDLHWSAPNSRLATGQQPMADRNTALAFWTSAAAMFQDNGLVVFDLFNEPYMDRDPEVATLDAAWDCWLNGCTLRVHDDAQNPTEDTYEAAGMQGLLDTVRATGATKPVLLGGLSYAEDFSEYLTHLPFDPLNQLVVSFHAYPGNPCGLDDTPCRQTIADLMTRMPLVAGEFGRDDCSPAGIEDFLTFLDTDGGSYIGWAWVVTQQDCGAGKYDLISDYDGTPTDTGAAVQAHYFTRP
jgi:hypothetical protein